jgi:photosystem II biogenesis protein Psp29
VSNVRTVSDTKRDFYNHHTRPINSIYRRVVEELMVEMHLLSVNIDFHYDPIYAFGVVTAFNRLMQGYRPERDMESIFTALCQAVGDDPQQYQQDAERLTAMAKLSGQEILSWFNDPTPVDGVEGLHETIASIKDNPKFKYSRLFAIGLYTLIEQSDPKLLEDEKKVGEVFKQVSQSLNLPEEKLLKDLELYRSNLEKVAQAQSAIEDIIRADRKKREQRTQDQSKATPPSEDEDSSSKDEAPSSGAS